MLVVLLSLFLLLVLSLILVLPTGVLFPIFLIPSYISNFMNLLFGVLSLFYLTVLNLVLLEYNFSSYMSFSTSQPLSYRKCILFFSFAIYKSFLLLSCTIFASAFLIASFYDYIISIHSYFCSFSCFLN